MIKSYPVVSIVLPTYNRADRLPAVFESILSQDFMDFELIIVDDGSTDDTEAIIRQIQEKEPRLNYIRLLKNRGLGFARSAGLRHATGQYIALADSDDRWVPGRLRLQIELLVKYPHIDILFGNFLDINHVKNTSSLGISESKKVFRLYEIHRLESDVHEITDGLESALLVSNFVTAPTMVLRKQVFDFVGGFNESLAATDLEFCWRAAVLGARFAYVMSPLIDRHIYSDNMTAQKDKTWLQRLRAISVMYEACKDWGRFDLIEHVRKTEIRTYRNLLRIYGEQSKSRDVVRTYIRSLSCGFSGRTLFLFLVSLFGPKAISIAQELNLKNQNL